MTQVTRNVGDKVYIANIGYGLNRDSFYLGEVIKVTPKGNVTVKFGNIEKRFSPYGYEIGGDKWSPHDHLDTDMSVQERSAWIARQNRLQDAAKAILAVKPEERVSANWGKAELLQEIQRLEMLLVIAKEKVNAIEEDSK